MNKKVITSLIVIVVLIILGIIVAKVAHNSSAPATTSTSNSNVNTSTGTSTLYANSTYGVSFVYPNKYALEEKDIKEASGKHHVITLITKADKELMTQIQGPVEGPTSITFDIYENAGKNVAIGTWVKTNSASNFSLSPDKKIASTSISSIEAVAYSWDGLYMANALAFEYRNNVIVATMTYNTQQDAIWKDFGGILQSLKLN